VLSPLLFSVYLDDVAKLNNYYNRRAFITIYADDVLLIASTVTVTKLEIV